MEQVEKGFVHQGICIILKEFAVKEVVKSRTKQQKFMSKLLTADLKFLVVINQIYDNFSHFLGWVQKRCDFFLPGNLDNKKINCFFTFVTHATLPDCQEPTKTTCQALLTQLVCCRFSSSLITKARARQIDRGSNITSSIIYPTSSSRSNSQEKGFPSLNQTGENSS